MKQKLCNWIYLALRKLGIKSTEHVNIHDLFDRVKELSPNDSHACSVSCTIIWYTHLKAAGQIWSVQNNERAFQSETFEAAFERYKAAQSAKKSAK